MKKWRTENVRYFFRGVIRSHRGPVWRAVTTPLYLTTLTERLRTLLTTVIVTVELDLDGFVLRAQQAEEYHLYVTQLTDVGPHIKNWINGGHPSVADGQVSRTVCFHWTAGHFVNFQQTSK